MDSNESKWNRAYAAAAEASGIIDPVKIQEFVAKQAKVKRDWGQAVKKVKVWEVWSKTCPRDAPVVNALLEAAKNGLPKDHGEQAKLAVYFFPDGDLSSIAFSHVTLTTVQEQYLFGLVSIQGMLMSGLLDPICTALGERANDVITAMARYWLVNYNSIWRHAVKIPCENGLSVSDSACNRDKILGKVFDSACFKVIENISDPKKKTSAVAAQTYMNLHRMGLDDMIKDHATQDDSVRHGAVVLSDAIYKAVTQTKDGWTVGNLSVITWGKTLKYPIKNVMERFTINGDARWLDLEDLMKADGQFIKMRKGFAPRWNKGEYLKLKKAAFQTEEKSPKGTGRYRLLK